MLYIVREEEGEQMSSKKETNYYLRVQSTKQMTQIVESRKRQQNHTNK